jgi:tRNA modification GTPase
LEGLREALLRKVVGGRSLEDSGARVTLRRHAEVLERARDSISSAIDSACSGSTIEFIALDVRGAIDAIGEITGENTSEDILNSIFSRFCVGK